MRCLPIIQRELQVAARRITTYKQRLTAGGVASAIVIVFALLSPGNSSTSGQILFKVVSTGGLVICFLQGLSETADSLSLERREGTLGLLFLTDLRGFDVVLGKLTAAAIKSFTLLLAMLPAFALPIWLGGVTAGEFWRAAGALGSALVFAMTTGLFASSISKTAFSALLGAGLLIVGFILLPTLAFSLSVPIPRWALGPIGLFTLVSEGSFVLEPSTFPKAFSYSTFLSIMFFCLSARFASKLEDAGVTRGRFRWWQNLLKPTVGYKEIRSASSRQINPAVWLATRFLPGQRFLWLIIIAATFICFVIGFAAPRNAVIAVFVVQLVFGFVLKLWIAVVAVQPFNSARRNGALELLLCTPLGAERLVRGHVDALRTYFIAPGLIAAFALVVGGALGTLIRNGTIGLEGIGAFIFGVGWFVSFAVDLNALIYMGLWHGLTETQMPRAIAKTVIRVLFLPWLSLLIPCVGILGLLIWPGVWIMWSSARLQRRFHKEAASQWAKDESGTKWFTWKNI